MKSGHIDQSHIATLKGDIEREGAVIGAFITLHPPTAPMREEAITARFYEPEFFPGKRYQKLQIITIEELLNGKQLEYPRMGPEVTFKEAEKRKRQNTGADEVRVSRTFRGLLAKFFSL